MICKVGARVFVGLKIAFFLNRGKFGYCMKKKSVFFTIFISILAGFLGGILSVFVLTPVRWGDVTSKTIERGYYVEESQTIEAITKVSSSVVSVVVFKDVPVGFSGGISDFGFSDPFFFTTPFLDEAVSTETEYREISGGTGFIVSPEGLVLTNKHVIDHDGGDLFVILADGTEHPAALVSMDPFEDVAVLQIISETEVFVPVVFGDSDSLQIGQKVFAVGNALGQYENTVTSGIISAKGRDVAAFNDFSSIVNFSGLLQTDAAINFGNSGGPLVDLDGEVIGMNAAIAEAASGISFAIPVNDLKPILASIVKYGEIIRPVLGVRFVMLTEKQASEMGLPVRRGALVIGGDALDSTAVVEDGAADLAGIVENDVIIEVNGVPVSVDLPLHKLIRKYSPGEAISLKIFRDGAMLDLGVVLKSTNDLE